MSAKRNEPCPCGSGEKYKRCCEGQEKARRSWIARLFAWGMVALFAGAVAIAFTGIRKGPSPSANPPDWYYDVAKDQYWDPRPGHEHFHKGPPPADAPRSNALTATAGLSPLNEAPAVPPQPTAAPEPWDYDPVTDRHWDPEKKSWQPGQPSSE